MRGGQAGELLVVIAILASVVVLVATVTMRDDVPDVPRAALEGLHDVRERLSRAILAWLEGGVVEGDLVCNGLYTVDESLLTRGLRPHVDAQLARADPEQGAVNVTSGLLAGIDMSGLDGFTIRLENGSIIYDDGTIYSEDSYEKEYFFSVRLPLALQVVQDWARCDAGNLSRNLASSFGEECFFGKKDTRYPGGCILPKIQYEVTDQDRQYMLGKGISAASVASGARASVDELNRYFAGESSCRSPPLADDTGISCSFEIEDLAIEHEMLPWTSEKIAVLEDVPTPTVSMGQLRAMGDELDFQQFVGRDAHVYALPADIVTYRYTDELLGCMDVPREPIDSGVDLPDYTAEPGRVDIATGEFDIFASPVLYVNVTRGARFTLKVTCTDQQATLLGQPLEYTFRLRQGVRQHCGPDLLRNGNFQCGGCGLKPGIDTSGCKTFALPSCGAAVQECTMNTVWLHVINSTPPLGTWDLGRGYLDNMMDPANLALREEVNASCGTVWQLEHLYPPPRDDQGRVICPSAQATVCCATPGYNDTCDPSRSLDNPSCYFSLDDYLGFCTQQRTCGERTCTTYTCDRNTANAAGEIFSCVERDSVDDGTSCSDDSGCFACQAGECKFVDAMEGQDCDPEFDDRDSCRQSVCRRDQGDGGMCWSEALPDQVGASCTSRFIDRRNPCSVPVCSPEGICTPSATPGSEGQACGTEIIQVGQRSCTVESFCQGGFCMAEADPDWSCTDDPDPGGCQIPPCRWDDDEGCVC